VIQVIFKYNDFQFINNAYVCFLEAFALRNNGELVELSCRVSKDIVHGLSVPVIAPHVPAHLLV
jgi:hypothetical protein